MVVAGVSRSRAALWAVPAMAFAILCGFGETEALAAGPPGSAACQALNGTSTGSIFVITAPGSYNGPFATGLAVGDHVTVTVSVFAFGSGTLDVVLAPSFASIGSLPPSQGASGTYVLAAAGDLYLHASATFIGTIGFACIGSAPTGPTNSQLLEQTRQVFSKVGAQASSQAMGDAAGGAIDDGFSGGGTTQFANGQIKSSFAAIENAQNADDKSSSGAQDANGAFAALGYAKAPYMKAPTLVRSPWYAWIDARFTGFDDKNITGFDGWHDNITGGASYRFTDNFLAGVLVGYENSKYSMTAFGTPTSLRGEGVSGGGYFGWKFFDRMRFDGMLTYGRINYDAAAGTVTGGFGADRVTGMTKLSGRYGFGTFYLEPSAMLTIASESQDSFTDTAAVFHDKYNFVVGRASTGGTIGTPFAWGTSVVTPTFGVFGDYRFGDETAAALSAVPTFNNGWSAHVNGGVSFAMSGGVTASATGEYGGLGDQIQYWRAKGSLGVKF
jgi:Autotransporter beta-domain